MIELGIPAVPFFGIDIVNFTIDFVISLALFLVVSLTLNLEAGFGGIPNFGKVMFVAGGAAVAGAVSGRVAVFILGVNTFGDYNTHIAAVINQSDFLLGDNFLLSVTILLTGLVIGALVGAALGFVFSTVVSRQNLREDYLGMLLLAAAQFFQIFLRSYEPFIGGTQGILVPDVFAWASPCNPPPSLACNGYHGIIVIPFILSLTGPKVRDVAALLVAVLLTGLVYLYSERVGRSPLGRTLRAIRDDETAARALGKNDVKVRRNIIVIASAISGIMGAFLTFYVSTVGPDTWTRITYTFYPWLIVIIGGAANNEGVVLGAFSFTILLKGIDQVKFRFASFFPFDVNWLYYLIFAFLLVFFLFVRPYGLLPEKPTETLKYAEVAELMKSTKESAQGTLTTIEKSDRDERSDLG